MPTAPDKNLEEIAIGEKPIDATVGESPAQFAEEVITNAQNAKTDLETSFAFYTKNPLYQTPEFVGVQENAHQKLDGAWNNLQIDVESVLKNPEPESEPQTQPSLDKQPDLVQNQESITSTNPGVFELKTVTDVEPKQEEKIPEPEQPKVEVSESTTEPSYPGMQEANIAEMNAPTSETPQNITADSKIKSTPETYDLKPEEPEKTKRGPGRPKKVATVPVIEPEAPKTPEPEIPVARKATLEEIVQAAGGKYSPEVKVTKKETKNQRQATPKRVLTPEEKEKSDFRKENKEVPPTPEKRYADMKERVASLQKRAEEYRRKVAERQSVAPSPEAKPPVDEQDVVGNIERAFQKSKVAESLPDAKEVLQASQKVEVQSMYDRFRAFPVLKPFAGLIDRLEASTAAKKAEKLSRKIEKIKAKIEFKEAERNGTNSPELITKITEQIVYLKEKLKGRRGPDGKLFLGKEGEKGLHHQKELYESRRNQAAEKTLLSINEKIAPRKERAEQIENKLKNLKQKVEGYSAYRNKKALEYNEILNKKTEKGERNTQYINLRNRTLKAILKEITKFDGLMDKYTIAYDKLKARKEKLDGVIARWQSDADSFSKLKDTPS